MSVTFGGAVYPGSETAIGLYTTIGAPAFTGLSLLGATGSVTITGTVNTVGNTVSVVYDIAGVKSTGTYTYEGYYAGPGGAPVYVFSGGAIAGVTAFAVSSTGAALSLVVGKGLTTGNIPNPCFAAGTLLDTPNGPVSVECLAEGDFVNVASGNTRRVKWIGFRKLDLTRVMDPLMAYPIRIIADAFDENLPRRDLRVSPDHALFVDGKLIAARLLVNGMTVFQETECREITYYHVELDAHDIVLAEGLPAESYLDTGNRSTFENADSPVDLHPDFAGADEDMRRAAGSCAPFATDEASVKPVWDRLAERAVALGHAVQASIAVTNDPDLCLMMDGRRIRPVSADNNRYVFMLPAVTGALNLASRSMVPADESPWTDDRRPLGVKIRQMTIRQGHDVQTLPVDHPMFTAGGWWAVEAADGAMWRWTDGNAVLGSIPGRAILEIELAAKPPAYPLSTATQAVVAGGRLAA